MYRLRRGIPITLLIYNNVEVSQPLIAGGPTLKCIEMPIQFLLGIRKLSKCLDLKLLPGSCC